MLTTNEAAELLGVTDRRIRQLISDGSLPAQRIGPRVLVINPKDLEKIRSRPGRGRPKKEKE